MGEELGAQMAMRTLGHMLQYGDASARRGVPLALALLYVSNPQHSAVDILSKLSHDADSQTATNSIVALGLVGAGTNNSRVANVLRALGSYNAQDAGLLFAVRLAQGLLHAGKGLLGFSPFHSNRALFNPAAAAALVVLSHTLLDFGGLVLGKHHYLLYVLIAAANPRMLITVDEVRARGRARARHRAQLAGLRSGWPRRCLPGRWVGRLAGRLVGAGLARRAPTLPCVASAARRDARRALSQTCPLRAQPDRLPRAPFSRPSPSRGPASSRRS
jgi:hypothetical protein